MALTFIKIMQIKTLLLWLLALTFSLNLGAQTPNGTTPTNNSIEETEVPIMTQLGTTQYKGKTIPHVILPALPKYAPMTFKKRQRTRAIQPFGL